MTNALFQLELNSVPDAECRNFAELDVLLALVCGLGQQESQWTTQVPPAPAKSVTLPTSSSEHLVIYDRLQFNLNLQLTIHQET